MLFDGVDAAYADVFHAVDAEAAPVIGPVFVECGLRLKRLIAVHFVARVRIRLLQVFAHVKRHVLLDGGVEVTRAAVMHVLVVHHFGPEVLLPDVLLQRHYGHQLVRLSHHCLRGAQDSQRGFR